MVRVFLYPFASKSLEVQGQLLHKKSRRLRHSQLLYSIHVFNASKNVTSLISGETNLKIKQGPNRSAPRQLTERELALRCTMNSPRRKPGCGACVPETKMLVLSMVMGMVCSVGRLMKVFHSGVGGCVRPRSFEYWG